MFRNQNIKPGLLDDRDLLFVEPAYEAAYKNKRLRPGDLLTMRTGYPGVTAVVPARYAAAQSFTTLITRPMSSAVESTYLCHYINSERGQAFFAQSQIGGAQKNVNAGTLRGMPVPLPAVLEQRAIAAALSDVDALLDGLTRLIAKKRDLKQAAMQQLLTGQTRLPGFHAPWISSPLATLAEIVMGQSPSSKSYKRRGEGLPLIQGNADIEQRRSVARVWTTDLTKEGRAGDLLLTVRAPVGAIGRASERCCLGRGVCALRPHGDPDFLFHALVFAEPGWRVLEQGSTFTAANSLQVAGFVVPAPRDVTEQFAIAAVLSGMDAELAALEARRDKTRLLKQGMMQELLTGRTRLV